MTPHRGFVYVHITYPYILTLPDLNFLDLGGSDPLLHRTLFEYPNLFSLFLMNPSVVDVTLYSRLSRCGRTKVVFLSVTEFDLVFYSGLPQH
jgi:hypothetical protein